MPRNEGLIDPSAGQRHPLRYAALDGSDILGSRVCGAGDGIVHSQSFTTRFPALRSAYCSEIHA